MLERRCQDSGEKFIVDDQDLRFYERVSPVFGGERFDIPPPVLSSASRLKQRLSFRNQTHVYFRKSSRNGSSVFTSYPDPCPFPIVSVDEWWSDDWDETDFGVDFDLSQPFFPQFMRLRDRVPHLPLSVSHLENSDYCSNASYLKDCYLVFNSSKAEDCIYCEAVTGSKSCIDCSYTKESELCYDCTMCIRCYECRSCLYSTGCRDSFYLMNCVNCSNCFGCVNLRNRSFCYNNEQLSEVEYRARIAAFNTGSWSQTTQARATSISFWKQNPRPNVEIENCQNCSGNYIYNSKGVRDSFFVRDCEDVRYAFGLDNGARDCQDITIPGFNPELCYQGMIIGFNVYRCLFSYRVAHQCSNLIYCWLCFYSKDCFGCVGLRRKQYCIFNKQYTKEQYEILVPKIIRKMQETGEWGQFFPARYSAIPYNLSFAQRYFPRTQKEVQAEGQRWLDEHVSESAEAVPAESLPDEVADSSDSLVISSENTGASFKITKHEIARYRKMKIPFPRSTYRERMDARFSLLGGVKPRQTVSKKSGRQIVTFPSADQEETNQIIWERQEYLDEFA